MIGDQVWWNVNVQPTPPTIPVIFCVDVEPDPRQVNRDAREPWVGYEFTQRYLRDLRPRIEALTEAPVHFSWFLRMDPQVAEPYGSAMWVAGSYRAQMDEIQRAGDEIGVHPHPYRWLECGFRSIVISRIGAS